MSVDSHVTGDDIYEKFADAEGAFITMLTSFALDQNRKQFIESVVDVYDASENQQMIPGALRELADALEKAE